MGLFIARKMVIDIKSVQKFKTIVFDLCLFLLKLKAKAAMGVQNSSPVCKITKFDYMTDLQITPLAS